MAIQKIFFEIDFQGVKKKFSLNLRFSDLISFRLFLVVLLVGLIGLGGPVFYEYQKGWGLSGRFDKLKKQEARYAKRIRLLGGQNAVAVISLKTKRQIRGFGSFLRFLSTQHVPGLWLNSFVLKIQPPQLELKGDALAAKEVQLYFIKVAERPPMRVKGLILRELTGVNAAEQKGSKKLRKKGIVAVAVGKIVGFTITNMKLLTKKQKNRLKKLAKQGKGRADFF
jgi:hypothetical protein